MNTARRISWPETALITGAIVFRSRFCQPMPGSMGMASILDKLRLSSPPGPGAPRARPPRTCTRAWAWSCEASPLGWGMSSTLQPPSPRCSPYRPFFHRLRQIPAPPPITNHHPTLTRPTPKDHGERQRDLHLDWGDDRGLAPMTTSTLPITRTVAQHGTEPITPVWFRAKRHSQFPARAAALRAPPGPPCPPRRCSHPTDRGTPPRDVGSTRGAAHERVFGEHGAD